MKFRRGKLLFVGMLCLALLPLAPSLKAQPSASRSVPVDRLVIAYEDGAFRLVSRIPLTKVLPPSDELPGRVGSVSGYWFELRSADESVVYRKLMQDPTRLVFDGPREGDALPERHEAALAKQVFTVLAPRAAVGSSLVLFGPSARLGDSARTAPAIPVARIPLDDKGPAPKAPVLKKGGVK
jgi:hypothetical protein